MGKGRRSSARGDAATGADETSPVNETRRRPRNSVSHRSGNETISRTDVVVEESARVTEPRSSRSRGPRERAQPIPSSLFSRRIFRCSSPQPESARGCRAIAGRADDAPRRRPTDDEVIVTSAIAVGECGAREEHAARGAEGERARLERGAASTSTRWTCTRRGSGRPTSKRRRRRCASRSGVRQAGSGRGAARSSRSCTTRSCRKEPSSRRSRSCS